MERIFLIIGLAILLAIPTSSLAVRRDHPEKYYQQIHYAEMGGVGNPK